MRAMFNIMEKKWIFFIIALAILVVGTVSMFTQGLTLGIDFAGGVIITYDIGEEFDHGEVEAIVRDVLGDNFYMFQGATLANDSAGFTVRFTFPDDLDTAVEGGELVAQSNFANQTRADLHAAIAAWRGISAGEINEGQRTAVVETAPPAEPITPVPPIGELEPGTYINGYVDGDLDIEQPDADEGVLTPATEQDMAVFATEGVVYHTLSHVSPETGRARARQTFVMVLIAAIIMLAYIWIRFELVTGCVLVLSLLFNLGVMITVYTLFQISINTAFIAALLTVLAYTSNDTIVVFDRIRENMRNAKKETYSSVANRSIWQSITRSINTSVTTLVTLCLLFMMGVVPEFALPIIIGIVIGTFSSIFLAAPLWAMWKDAGIKEVTAKK